MLVGQFRLGHRRRGQASFQPHLIEHVVEHRHAALRITPQGAVMIGAWHPAELFPDGRVAGQAQQRTVHREEPVPAPALHQAGVLRPIDGGQHRRGVEFDKGAGAQFGPRMGEGAATEPGRRGPVGQLLQERRQMGLEGLEAFLQQQEQEHGKGQHALAGEVTVAAAVARAEERIDQRPAQLFNEGEGAELERERALPPHCKSRICLRCTFKSITTSSCFNGSGERPDPA